MRRALSSRTSCSKALMLRAMSDQAPPGLPLSTSTLLNYSFSVCGAHPILPAIDTIADHRERYRLRGLIPSGHLEEPYNFWLKIGFVWSLMVFPVHGRLNGPELVVHSLWITSMGLIWAHFSC